MNVLRSNFTAPLLTCLLAVNYFSLPLLAQSPAKRPATKSGHTFAPAAPGQKVAYRPAGDNAIEIAARPGVPTLADKAIAAKRGNSPAILQASTSHLMQEPAEEVPAPAARPQGERSVVVPNSNGVVMEEVPAGKIIQQGPWIDSQSGQVVGDQFNQPFFTNEQEGGVVMEDGMAAEGCSDCGCYGGVRDGLRILRPCADGCLIPCPRISIDNTQVFAGAQSFNNRQSLGFGAGTPIPSVGFHEGVNLGGPFPFLPLLDLSMQMGVEGVHSNFNGGGGFGNPVGTRNQLFATVGLFRRVDWGFQGGFVLDYMHDRFFYTLDMYQIRGDLSWVNPEGHEIGFWGTTSNNTRTRPTNLFGVRGAGVSTFNQTDIYAFYYRKRFCETNGFARVFGGATQDGDGIVGVDGTAPLSDSFALSGAFTYMIPNAKAGNILPANSRETWNLQLSLVWYPGAGARQWTYHRPMFDVANNGTFLTKHFP
jgi:hypothetical protein